MLVSLQIKNATEAGNILDGVSGLLTLISLSSEGEDIVGHHRSDIKVPAFDLLADIVKSVSDFLSDNEIEINKALRVDSEKTAKKPK